jgi:hypothetical protein
VVCGEHGHGRARPGLSCSGCKCALLDAHMGLDMDLRGIHMLEHDVRFPVSQCTHLRLMRDRALELRKEPVGTCVSGCTTGEGGR